MTTQSNTLEYVYSFTDKTLILNTCKRKRTQLSSVLDKQMFFKMVDLKIRYFR